MSPARILYFPKGTYLVSDTISHKLENLKNILQGVPTMEINRQIYIKGEDKDTTVIKLKDNCPSFGLYSGIGGKEAPLYINDNSHMSVYMLTACVTDKTSWDVLIREKSSLDVKDFTKDDAQKIDRFSHRVPGYVR